METFGEEISAEACPGKEIAGLLRKMMMMMTRKCEIACDKTPLTLILSLLDSVSYTIYTARFFRQIIYLKCS